MNGDFEVFLLQIQSPALRALAQFWHEARGSKQMPSWTDVESSVVSIYSNLLWSYSYDPETGEFVGRSASNRYSMWVGGNFRGKQLKDVQPSTHQDARPLLTRIVTTPLAARTSGRLFTTSDLVVTGERIILPVAADGMTGDGVLGASDYAAPPLLGPFELVHENIEWYAI